MHYELFEYLLNNGTGCEQKWHGCKSAWGMSISLALYELAERLSLLQDLKSFQCYIYTQARLLFGDWNLIQLLHHECFSWVLFLPRPELLHHRLHHWYILFFVYPWGSRRIPAASWACAGWSHRVVASTTCRTRLLHSHFPPVSLMPGALPQGALAKLTGVTPAALSYLKIWFVKHNLLQRVREVLRREERFLYLPRGKTRRKYKRIICFYTK